MGMKINENKDENDYGKWNERGNGYLSKRNQWSRDKSNVFFKLQFLCCKSKWNCL